MLNGVLEVRDIPNNTISASKKPFWISAIIVFTANSIALMRSKNNYRSIGAITPGSSKGLVFVRCSNFFDNRIKTSKQK